MDCYLFRPVCRSMCRFGSLRADNSPRCEHSNRRRELWRRLGESFWVLGFDLWSWSLSRHVWRRDQRSRFLQLALLHGNSGFGSWLDEALCPQSMNSLVFVGVPNKARVCGPFLRPLLDFSPPRAVPSKSGCHERRPTRLRRSHPCAPSLCARWLVRCLSLRNSDGDGLVQTC